MPLAPRPAEPPHRHPVLEPDLRARSQRRPPLGTAAVNEPQLEPGTSELHPPRRSRQNGHHIRDDPEPGKLRWQDTPDEQDSMSIGKIICQRTATFSSLSCLIEVGPVSLNLADAGKAVMLIATAVAQAREVVV